MGNGNDQNQYAIDIAFDLTETSIPDGFYRSMEWGVAWSPAGEGDWQTVTVNDRHNGDYGWGSVSLTDTLGLERGDSVTFSVFCKQAMGDDPGDLAKVLWVRYAFRPAMSVPPGNANLKITPFNANDTNDLLQGIDLSVVTDAGSGVSQGIDGQTFDTALDSVESHVGNGQYLTLVNIPDNSTTQYNYEFTAYLCAEDVDSNVYYFKTDPELITGKRSGG